MGKILVREIEISIPAYNTKAVAQLLEDSAPKTCDAIWKALPIEQDAIHAAWSGECVMFQHDIKIDSIELQTMYVGPGEFGLNLPQGNPARPSKPEIQIYYGRAQPRWQRGPTPVVVFATITQNMKGLGEACKNIHRKGIQKIVISKKL